VSADANTREILATVVGTGSRDGPLEDVVDLAHRDEQASRSRQNSLTPRMGLWQITSIQGSPAPTKLWSPGGRENRSVSASSSKNTSCRASLARARC